jgi:hypothetical protein
MKYSQQIDSGPYLRKCAEDRDRRRKAYRRDVLLGWAIAVVAVLAIAGFAFLIGWIVEGGA